MTNLPITREEALDLIKKYNKEKSDLNHYLESEAIMKDLAKKFGEDEEYWAMLGLLHDVDWGITKSDINKHLSEAPIILKEAGFDDEFISLVISHGYGYNIPGIEGERKKKIEHALACAETATGLIHAYALMRNGKISDMEVKGLKKKFKDKKFAAAVRRDIIIECEKIGLSLDEFFELSINSVKDIADQVGLS